MDFDTNHWHKSRWKSSHDLAWRVFILFYYFNKLPLSLSRSCNNPSTLCVQGRAVCLWEEKTGLKGKTWSGDSEYKIFFYKWALWSCHSYTTQSSKAVRNYIQSKDRTTMSALTAACTIRHDRANFNAMFTVRRTYKEGVLSGLINSPCLVTALLRRKVKLWAVSKAVPLQKQHFDRGSVWCGCSWASKLKRQQQREVVVGLSQALKIITPTYSLAIN